MARITFFYRSTGDEKKEEFAVKQRPPYFSKLACLKSFLVALEKLNEDYEVVFYNDSAIPAEREKLMKKYGKVIQGNGKGNAKSFGYLLELGKKAKSELVYFAEDDYLYMPNALKELIGAFDKYPEASYITLYDHPDKYKKIPAKKPSKLRWKNVISTCFTFGARRKALRSDINRMKFFLIGMNHDSPLYLKAFRYVISFFAAYDWDHEMWMCVQGKGPFFLNMSKKTLLSSEPGLATHVNNLPSPYYDWKKQHDAAQRAKV